jgi:hypothetical protein
LLSLAEATFVYAPLGGLLHDGFWHAARRDTKEVQMQKSERTLGGEKLDRGDAHRDSAELMKLTLCNENVYSSIQTLYFTQVD